MTEETKTPTDFETTIESFAREFAQCDSETQAQDRATEAAERVVQSWDGATIIEFVESEEKLGNHAGLDPGVVLPDDELIREHGPTVYCASLLRCAAKSLYTMAIMDAIKDPSAGDLVVNWRK